MFILLPLVDFMEFSVKSQTIANFRLFWLTQFVIAKRIGRQREKEQVKSYDLI
jgi:hypothetical protein